MEALKCKTASTNHTTTNLRTQKHIQKHININNYKIKKSQNINQTQLQMKKPRTSGLLKCFGFLGHPNFFFLFFLFLFFIFNTDIHVNVTSYTFSNKSFIHVLGVVLQGVVMFSLCLLGSLHCSVNSSL